ncbi:MAG: beta-hydroxyacyl-ACP dehydratase [Opitutae bacterium]|nr:beta-hydroxyacyl-ACP dehydratase [Opitutae bacterium]
MESILQLIPHRPPFLFVDAIVARTESSLIATRTWRADEDFYQGHYPGAPITPGVLLCESVFQTGALLLAGKLAGQGTPRGVPLLAKVENVRFRSPVYPGDTTTVEVKINEIAGGFYLMSGHMKNGDKRVLNVDFAVAWKTPEGQS